MSSDKSFLGTGWAFPPRFNTQGAELVRAEQDIEESLRILLATALGERVMQPTYGCGLKLHVFDSIDESTITIIMNVVRRAILFFEPRITVENISIKDMDALEGKLSINILYRVRATNNRYNLVYPFYFNEATNVAR